MRTVLIISLVLITGIVSLWQATDGFVAFTSEQARRIKIAQEPQQLPQALIEDQDGQLFHLNDYQGRIVIVDFFYTGCRTLCLLLNAKMQALYDILINQQQRQDVIFLSISFDSDNDTPEQLKKHAQRYRAESVYWRFARINDTNELKVLLAAFGIVVIPIGWGDFEHNGAIHVINRAGRLAKIFDYNSPHDRLMNFE